MQLTYLSVGFETSLLVLATSTFLFAWVAERVLFPHLARFLGHAYTRLRPGHGKQRRQYKVLLEEMQKGQ